MLSEDHLLPPPRVTPVLDPGFRPAALASNYLRERAIASGNPIQVTIGLEQSDGSISRFETVLPAGSSANRHHLERLIKFLLWSRGGWRVIVDAPEALVAELHQHYTESPTGRFDAEMMGDRIYGRSFEVVRGEVPPAQQRQSRLGRNMNGCRIGFDLGGSDRKVAAVIDGQCVFSEEIVWNPVPQTDPQWHFDQIMDSLNRAAQHLPRVDAIGGSSAGVYVNNRVKLASLFRGVPRELFKSRVEGIFLELQKAWKGIPFEVANDGEVTALAGSMALNVNGVLGIALGTSTAGGYVTPEGTITTWLNELAFTPVDYSPKAAVDEWSGDYGCGALYFSQQAVGKLVEIAGIPMEPGLPLPEQLKVVQALMAADDFRARKIYETIGTYLGYEVAHYAQFYEFSHLLILGRVTSGQGGDIILDKAREVLKAEPWGLDGKITFHVPDEKEKRHGQAMAAASLPVVK